MNTSIVTSDPAYPSVYRSPKAGKLDDVKIARALANGATLGEAAIAGGSRGKTGTASAVLRRKGRPEFEALVSAFRCDALSSNRLAHSKIMASLGDLENLLPTMSAKDRLELSIKLDASMLALQKAETIKEDNREEKSLSSLENAIITLSRVNSEVYEQEQVKINDSAPLDEEIEDYEGEEPNI